MGSRKIRITSIKQLDQIKKKTATDTLRAGICCKTKSESTMPFLASMALKKEGKEINMPVKTSMPAQNFHLKDGIFHAVDQVRLKGER
jgi:hypothetical protein